MILLVYWWIVPRLGYPCTSGDDPDLLLEHRVSFWLSLHKRGWSWKHWTNLSIKQVIPAQAGMILSSHLVRSISVGYPCTSGDDPGPLSRMNNHSRLSLHKRGWSPILHNNKLHLKVIPAQAGMILINTKSESTSYSYPCTSGDDPGWIRYRIIIKLLSLHKRGWS